MKLNGTCGACRSSIGCVYVRFNQNGQCAVRHCSDASADNRAAEKIRGDDRWANSDARLHDVHFIVNELRRFRMSFDKELVKLRFAPLKIGQAHHADYPAPR